MNKTTRILLSIGMFLLVLTVFYLIGSFIVLSFDVAKWGRFGRYMGSVFGVFVACIASHIVYNETK